MLWIQVHLRVCSTIPNPEGITEKTKKILIIFFVKIIQTKDCLLDLKTETYQLVFVEKLSNVWNKIPNENHTLKEFAVGEDYNKITLLKQYLGEFHGSF